MCPISYPNKCGILFTVFNFEVLVLVPSAMDFFLIDSGVEEAPPA